MPNRDYVLLPLSRNMAAKIDPALAAEVTRWDWSVNMTKAGPYAHRLEPRDENGRRKKVYLHRVVAKARPGQIIDHINGDTLDCRRSNLRATTQSSNMQNSTRRYHGKTGYRGVNKKGSKFVAAISVEGRQQRIGTFDTAKEAALAFDRRARELFPETRGVNFP